MHLHEKMAEDPGDGDSETNTSLGEDEEDAEMQEERRIEMLKDAIAEMTEELDMQ
eukprot:gene9120-5542_t